MRTRQGTCFEEVAGKVSIATQTWETVYVYEDKTYDLEDVQHNKDMYPRYMKKVRAQNYRYGNIPYIPTPEEQKERR